METASNQRILEAFPFLLYKAFVLICLPLSLCQSKSWWLTSLLWVNSIWIVQMRIAHSHLDSLYLNIFIPEEYSWKMKLTVLISYFSVIKKCCVTYSLISNEKFAVIGTVYLIYMQSTSWETLDWKKHKLESRLWGEISITSDMQMTPPLGRKWRGTKKPVDESERGEWKSWLKAQHSENKDRGIRSHHFMGNRWGNSGVTHFIFWALKSLQVVIAAVNLKGGCSLEEMLWPP